MFLWREELQIHEHGFCASAADILEQVNDLSVFVCHSSQAGLCLCVLGKSLFILQREQTSLQMEPANLSPFYFLV